MPHLTQEEVMGRLLPGATLQRDGKTVIFSGFTSCSSPEGCTGCPGRVTPQPGGCGWGGGQTPKSRELLWDIVADPPLEESPDINPFNM